MNIQAASFWLLPATGIASAMKLGRQKSIFPSFASNRSVSKALSSIGLPGGSRSKERILWFIGRKRISLQFPLEQVLNLEFFMLLLKAGEHFLKTRLLWSRVCMKWLQDMFCLFCSCCRATGSLCSPALPVLSQSLVLCFIKGYFLEQENLARRQCVLQGRTEFQEEFTWLFHIPGRTWRCRTNSLQEGNISCRHWRTTLWPCGVIFLSSQTDVQDDDKETFNLPAHVKVYIISCLNEFSLFSTSTVGYFPLLYLLSHLSAVWCSFHSRLYWKVITWGGFGYIGHQQRQHQMFKKCFQHNIWAFL